jgi:hypothetical protein
MAATYLRFPKPERGARRCAGDSGWKVRPMSISIRRFLGKQAIHAYIFDPRKRAHALCPNVGPGSIHLADDAHAGEDVGASSPALNILGPIWDSGPVCTSVHQYRPGCPPVPVHGARRA